MTVVRLGRALATMFVASTLLTSTAMAQAIYPADRAEILAGAKFDFKVEFAKKPAQSETDVTINGRPVEDFFGKPGTFVVDEDGWGLSALWFRDVELPAAGRYEVTARGVTGSKTATWDAFSTKPRTTKNVILFIGDGMSVAHRTAARMLSKGITNGRYGGQLAMDDMSNMALVSTSGIESIITDSTNSMTAYTTGHKTCGGAMATYCSGNKSPLDHPRVEPIGSLVKRRHGMALGIVTTTEVVDATPGAVLAQSASRSTRREIAEMLLKGEPDILLGGGRSYFVPKSEPGSKRNDDTDLVAQFRERGYRYVTTATDLASTTGDDGRLLGLFHMSNIDGVLDRRITKAGTVKTFPDQPDLTDMVRVALDRLSKKPEGFFLMVESGRIDQFSHALDWERAVYETILLDNAVKIAKDWAEPRGDTLIVVVADHAHPVSIIGTIDDAKKGGHLRDKMAVYDAGFPNYPAPDADGYPPTVDVSRRLAFVFGAAPDHCTAGKPQPGGYWPTQSAGGNTYAANEKFCVGGTTRLSGNLPFGIGAGVHAGDDVVLTANGPGADKFRGHMENTRVFRAIAEALGLAPPK